MTPEERAAAEAKLAEIRAWLRDYNQTQRDKRLRRGRAKPRNRREMEIFAKDLLQEPKTGREPEGGAPE